MCDNSQWSYNLSKTWIIDNPVLSFSIGRLSLCLVKIFCFNEFIIKIVLILLSYFYNIIKLFYFMYWCCGLGSYSFPRIFQKEYSPNFEDFPGSSAGPVSGCKKVNYPSFQDQGNGDGLIFLFIKYKVFNISSTFWFDKSSNKYEF